MGDLIDRMRNKGRENSEYSIQVQDEPEAEDAPVIKRIQLMLDYFISNIGQDTAKNKRVAYMLKRIATEAADEMADVPPEIIELYFKQAAGVMFWAATGEQIINIPLPAGFETPKELSAKPTPAIEAGIDDAS